MLQSCGNHDTGIQRLNVNLLKPDRINVANRGDIVSLRNASSISGWVQYQPRLKCPLLRYLPHFLATFIVENLAEAVNLPEPPAVKPRESSYTDHKGRKWSIGILNKVLNDVLVSHSDGTQIAVIGAAEWESEKYAGVTKLHVRTLDKFFGKERRVMPTISDEFTYFHIVSHIFI